MKSISRFIYGPTNEEKAKKWQNQLRTEQRQLDREVRNVSGNGFPYHGAELDVTYAARHGYSQISCRAKAACQEERSQVSQDLGQGGRKSEQATGSAATEQSSARQYTNAGAASDV